MVDRMLKLKKKLKKFFWGGLAFAVVVWDTKTDNGSTL